ncbi:ABC transporter ATP-binding protein [Paenibacillus sp. FSL R7-0048]|jgi:ATP-binding cassette subfamily B protein|uniref:Multidrug ABC transporter ATP-binding protein n=1 Tax=Paenibacillus odorifer TaxID=189426 RepID=A0ABX3GDH3_9BACL|nr:ABC transporter ATP-binding protein [Paenibacillus odorifer]OMC75388.1 multidrug ABC transporter ATP-binding protein [Paenibacillus odorifer]OMD05291.1 multidrug ABC transporter ATP-binding protein [Paenibacillus odorifer]OMD59745.1 multidrug ABC transporter ATP-binding protein [Paenibacillus odorifer]OMD71148.1 multidrug ABC transporter ATP-binding protein [Paenibacillus odorifer]OMD80255.1 multidrug ABC transporter ATP-binding protein [Paenibacillus odorifer]
MLRRFFSYYRPYRKLFILDFSCAVFAGLLELAFPVAVNKFIDDLLPGQDWPLILIACVALLAIYALNTVMQYIVTYWGHMLGINIETDMRKKMFDHIQKLSFRFFDNNKTGHLIGRITNDLNDIGEVAHHGPEDVFIAIMTLVGAFLLMADINLKLAIITFIIVPIMAWVIIYFGRNMTSTYRQLFGNVGSFNARIEDNVGGIRVVQSFANEQHEQELFAVDNQMFRKTKLMAYKIMARSLSVSYMMTRLITILVMICGAWFFINGELQIGEFVAFILLSNIFFRPIEKINAVIESYPKGIAGFRRYLEIIDTEPDISDKPDAVEINALRGDITFQDVSFGYEENRPVLQNISLNVKAGETIAFVGPSGAGKTTICSLLPRFYDVTAGAITIDGIDIRDMKLESLRKQIGIVQQDVFLFSGTIRENIAYGKLDAKLPEIWEAARRAHLEELIQNLPDGMETVIGERGVKLSGGQKQRLAIARMFLKNPPILILDEATSALDTETEAAIQQSLADLSVGRTTLVIAHRLTTIKNADRIMVVNEEGIAEQGRHEELVHAGGIYSRLHQAQYNF